MEDIIGYEGLYSISKNGDVYSYISQKILKPYTMKKGYKVVDLYTQSKNKKKHLIHVLVCTAFLPNPDNKPTVNHIDHDAGNNNLENLEWATYSEQTLHSPCPIGKSGHRNIYQMPCGKFYLQIQRNGIVHCKAFSSINDAINVRDMLRK
jgi:hypothetical protein